MNPFSASDPGRGPCTDCSNMSSGPLVFALHSRTSSTWKNQLFRDTGLSVRILTKSRDI